MLTKLKNLARFIHRLLQGVDRCSINMLYPTRVTGIHYRTWPSGWSKGSEKYCKTGELSNTFGVISPIQTSSACPKRLRNPISMSSNLLKMFRCYRRMQLLSGSGPIKWWMFSDILKMDFGFRRSWVGWKQRDPPLVSIITNRHIINLDWGTLIPKVAKCRRLQLLTSPVQLTKSGNTSVKRGCMSTSTFRNIWTWCATI